MAALGAGKPLEIDVRKLMEPRIESNLSGVRVHSDPQAETLAWRLGARAFTYGRHLVFGRAAYIPSTRSGVKLLPHELAHYVQQEHNPGLRSTVHRQTEDLVCEPDLPATDLSNPTEREEALRECLPEDERHLPLYSEPPASATELTSAENELNALDAAAELGSGLTKQYWELAQTGAERVRYVREARLASQQIRTDYESGRITAEVAEERAVATRRRLEAATRSRLPGPEPARTLNEMAARRNVARYGDPLGYRDPAHLRSQRPKATTKGIIRSAGRPNVRVTGLGVAGGALGVVGGVLAVSDLSDAFAGRKQVDLEGLDPSDFPVGHEFRGVYLGEGWFATIRVERNIIGRRKFYIVSAGQMV